MNGPRCHRCLVAWPHGSAPVALCKACRVVLMLKGVVLRQLPPGLTEQLPDCLADVCAVGVIHELVRAQDPGLDDVSYADVARLWRHPGQEAAEADAEGGLW